MKTAFDLIQEDGSAPSFFDCTGCIEIPDQRVVLEIQKDHSVPPRQLRNRLLRNCRGEFGSKLLHVLKIPWRKSGHVGELALKVHGEASDHFGAPALY